MGSARLRVLVAGAGVAFAAMLVLATPTFALDFVVSNAKPLPDTGTGSAMVKCPNGTHVLSGGQHVSAVCAGREPRYVFARKPVGAEGFYDTVRRPCPRGTHVTGGGVRLAGADQGAIFLARSGPVDLGDGNEAPDDGWAPRGFNEEGRRDMIVHAVCGRQARKYAFGSATAPPQGSAEAEAVCPGGGAVIGGRIDTSGLGILTITSSYPPFGDGWSVEADNYFFGASADVDVFAICLA